jgi:hypothetical protein
VKGKGKERKRKDKIRNKKEENFKNLEKKT